MDIGYLGAFLGGVLSLLSPCSAMLLPAFFAYAFSHPSTLIARTGIFYAGLVTTLVPLGVFAGTLGSFLNANRALFLTIVAVVIIVFGLVQVSGIPVPGLTPRHSKDADPGSPWAVYVLGTAYGLAGACTGPILGSVLVIAAAGGTPIYGAILLAIYAAGMTLPLLLLALGWKRWSTRFRTFLAPRELTFGRWTNSWNAIIAGILSIALGIVLLLIAQNPEIGGFLPIGIEYQIQTGVQAFAQRIPNGIVFAVIAIVLALVGALWWHRHKANPSGKSAGRTSTPESRHVDAKDLDDPT